MQNVARPIARAILAAATPPVQPRELSDEEIFALAREHFGRNGHDLIHKTSPVYAAAMGMEQDARWTVQEVRPEQTLAFARSLLSASRGGGAMPAPTLDAVKAKMSELEPDWPFKMFAIGATELCYEAMTALLTAGMPALSSNPAPTPEPVRYTSWCDKHSRATPCDRCALGMDTCPKGGSDGS